jgi:replicative DNA helicase Mcm
LSEEIKYTDSALSDKIKKFLQEFKDNNGRYVYVDKIDTMMPQNKTWLTVKYTDFAHGELEVIFHKEPERVLREFQRAIKEILQARFSNFAESIKEKIRVRISEFPKNISTREINEEYLEQFVSVYGFITKTGKPIYVPTKIKYTCYAGHFLIADSEFGISDLQHSKCNDITSNKRCGKEWELEEPLYLMPIENVSVQDLPNVLPPGEIPGQTKMIVTGPLIQECRPGDKVIISGILKKYRINPRSKIMQFKLILHANHVKKISSEQIDITDESNHEIKKILKLEENKRYQILIKSIAPHIHGHNAIKESMLLLLAAHAPKNLTDYAKIKWDGIDDDEYDMIKQRWDINIFLVGDPGSAKSEMLKFVAKVAPRGIYTSGRGSTAVGLTAALIKDPLTNEYEIAAGAMVLADLGVVAIDEFDKMKDEDRSACHETMENQTATIAKGGVYAQLNARTSTLAAANPKTGKYDPFKTVYENTKLPIPLLTRFDLIFTVRDIPNKKKDMLVAQRILDANTNLNSLTTNTITPKILTKYLSYTKQFHPTPTKEAETMMKEYYVSMRNKNNNDGDDNFTITARQFEAILRIATARASILTKDKVDENDVKRAIELMKEMLQDTAIDPNTGKVDMATMHTGHTKSTNSKIVLLVNIIKGLVGDSYGPGASEKEILDEMVKSGRWDDEITAKIFFKNILKENQFYESSPEHFKLVS